ncbi:MAG: Xaa-Pro peptidase family protein [Nitrososphaerota archaeon]|nr:Xaa-Pro peptidase family protein [Nitrososphaerota archaeon]
MSFGIVGTESEERINWERLRNYRQERALRKIKENGFGAFLAFYEENIRYITGTRGPPWTRDKPGLRYAMMMADGDILLYEQGDNRYHALRNNPWIKRENIRYSYATWIKGASGPAASQQALKFAEDIKNEMKKHKVVDLPLATDFIDYEMLAAFNKVGLKVVNGLGAIHNARAIKSKDEIEAERIAAAIGDAIHYEATKILRPGISENEVMAHLFDYAYSIKGVDYIETIIVSSGPNTWPNNRNFTDRMIDYGDLVFIDVVIAWNGYHTCYYRTYSIGRQPTTEQKDYYKLTLDWLYSAINVVRPGITTREIAEKFPSAKEVWGYEEEEEAAANLWGHGLGLSHYDLPLVSRINSLEYPYPIEEGMVFALETQHGKMFKWGIRIEEMLVVTETGHEILTKFPVDEITKVP